MTNTDSATLTYERKDGKIGVFLSPGMDEEISVEPIRSALRRWELWRRSAARDAAELGEIGLELGDELIPYSLQRRIQSLVGASRQSGVSFRLFVEGEADLVAQTPWEVLSLRSVSPLDPIDGMFAHQPDVAIVRRSPSSAHSTYEPLTSELRVLIATANPASERYPPLAWLATEIQAIESACSRAHSVLLNVRLLSDASPQELRRTISDFRPHVFHFAGHGEATPTGSTLVLQGEKPRMSANLNVGALSEWLVAGGCLIGVLSACETDGQAASSAATMAMAGMPAVVGVQATVSDVSLPSFSRVLYSSLLDGAEIDRAVTEARLSMAGPSCSEVLPTLWCDSPFALVGTRRFAGQNLRANNLPLVGQNSLTVGRGGELAKIVASLGSHRTVCLFGPGGIGKSHLAHAAARMVLDTYVDGVWFLDCGSMLSSDDVWSELSVHLGVDRQPDPKEEAIHALTNRSCLVVLDGFEWLVARSETDVLRELLERTSVAVLATSRTRLRIEGFKTIEVGSLVSGGIQAPAESLFLKLAGIERASLNREEIVAVSEACAALNGVPLALAVAASRARVVGVRELRNMLGQSPIRALGGLSSAVGVAVQRSLSLIPSSDRDLLRRLCLFAGSFNWDSASSIYPEDRFEMLDGMERLVDGSLLRRVENAGKIRFQILDSVRDYVSAMRFPTLPSESEAAVNDRHLQYFLGLARQAAILFNNGDWHEGNRTVSAEIANFRQAAKIAHDESQPEITSSFAECLCRPLMESGMWADFEKLAGQGYEAAAERGDHRLRAMLLGLEGALAGRRGNSVACMDAWERRAALCKEIGDCLGQVDTLLDLASEAREARQFDRSLVLLLEAEDAMQALGRPDLEATASVIRATIHLDRGMLDEAREAALVAESKQPERGERDTMLYVRTKLGHLWRRLGDLPKAEAAYILAIEDAIDGDRRSQAAIAALGLSTTLEERGKIEGALMCAIGAETLLRTLGSSRLREAEIRLADLLQGNANHPSIRRRARISSTAPYELIEEVLGRTRDEREGL